LRLVPAALEIRFDLVELATGVTLIRLPAVAVGRDVLRVGCARVDVGTAGVVVTPVGFLDRGIERSTCLHTPLLLGKTAPTKTQQRRRQLLRAPAGGTRRSVAANE